MLDLDYMVGVWEMQKAKLYDENLSVTQSHCSEQGHCRFIATSVLSLFWELQLEDPPANLILKYFESSIQFSHRVRWGQNAAVQGIELPQERSQFLFILLSIYFDVFSAIIRERPP